MDEHDPQENWIQLGKMTVSRRLFRQWCMGQRPLPGQDPRLFFAELPREEFGPAVERYFANHWDEYSDKDYVITS